MARPNKWQSLGVTRTVRYPEQLLELFDYICDMSENWGTPIAVLFPEGKYIVHKDHNNQETTNTVIGLIHECVTSDTAEGIIESMILPNGDSYYPKQDS